MDDLIQEAPKRRYKYTVSWCKLPIPEARPHVHGIYDERTFDSELRPEPQLVEIFCTHPSCAGKPAGYYRIMCTSGAVGTHVDNFALSHMHFDPFARGA